MRTGIVMGRRADTHKWEWIDGPMDLEKARQVAAQEASDSAEAFDRHGNDPRGRHDAFRVDESFDKRWTDPAQPVGIQVLYEVIVVPATVRVTERIRERPRGARVRSGCPPKE